MKIDGLLGSTLYSLSGMCCCIQYRRDRHEREKLYGLYRLYSHTRIATPFAHTTGLLKGWPSLALYIIYMYSLDIFFLRLDCAAVPIQPPIKYIFYIRMGEKYRSHIHRVALAPMQYINAQEPGCVQAYMHLLLCCCCRLQAALYIE